MPPPHSRPTQRDRVARTGGEASIFGRGEGPVASGRAAGGEGGGFRKHPLNRASPRFALSYAHPRAHIHHPFIPFITFQVHLPWRKRRQVRPTFPGHSQCQRRWVLTRQALRGCRQLRGQEKNCWWIGGGCSAGKHNRIVLLFPSNPRTFSCRIAQLELLGRWAAWGGGGGMEEG